MVNFVCEDMVKVCIDGSMYPQVYGLLCGARPYTMEQHIYNIRAVRSAYSHKIPRNAEGN